VLYDTELLVITRLNAFINEEPNRGITLRLRDHFHFVPPSNPDDAASILSETQDDEHFYFMFETCRSNLFQTISSRKQKLLQSKPSLDDETETMSTSTMTNVIKFNPILKWSEGELLSLIDRLVHIMASLQRVNVAHRNIKPANLVFCQPSKDTKSDAIDFNQLLICNFEMATCFQADSHYSEHLCAQEQECSAIYASPLVQQKVQQLNEKP
jgi:serine/threonine protein kinase